MRNLKTITTDEFLEKFDNDTFRGYLFSKNI